MKLYNEETASTASAGFALAGTAKGYLYTVINLLTLPKALVKDVASIKDETVVCIEGLAAVLEQHGYSLGDVVKFNAYLADNGSDSRSQFMAGYTEAFGAAANPARCTYGAGLEGGCRVQFDVTAYRAPAA